jgi:pyruvate/2-oxoglutarate dehydrogenase complex dihydrolipoamide acyltransferase (E2) component
MDVCAVGKQKHHVTALLEMDVTLSRESIRQLRKNGQRVSFTAWLIKAISQSIRQHEQAAAFLKSKRKIVIFNDINISLLVEKSVQGQKVPFPLLIKKADTLDLAELTRIIEEAKNSGMEPGEMVMHQKPGFAEKLYARLPGFLRRGVWKLMLKRPHFVFEKMGNIAITSIGMMGRVDGWFIPIGVHPLCFGISNISQLPKVVDGQVQVRDILKMTVLMDHDVIDGAPMARFISTLARHIEGANEQ